MQENTTQFNFDAIGTKWQIDIYRHLSPEREKDLFGKIKARIDAFDKAYSRFRPDSLVTKISKEAGTYVLSDDAPPMMSLYYDIYKKTGGLVTPLIGNLISDAGYDASYSLQQKKELQTPPAWDDALEYKHPQLIVHKPVLLDFGAAGKGYLIDIVGKLIETEGYTGFCIDAGGDILHKNTESIRIGLENPENIDQVVGVCTLGNASICGSAGNRRTWGDFTHIINPQTRTSPRNILAVWVIADTALLADMLATCLFFIEPKALSNSYSFEYAIIRSDHSLEKSAGFPGEFF